MSFKKLTPKEEQVIIHKATEPPFSGKYFDNNLKGEYFCKRCSAKLFSTKDQFDSGCGWPSFDDESQNSVKQIPDADGRRTEILCANCDAHLGHIFKGEGFTTKDKRYCVNSISLDFLADKNDLLQSAYFAGGCFWGMEYFFKDQKGVKSVTCGYMGGKTEFPNYEQVCHENTGHVEVIQVIFDPEIIDYEKLCRLFFEIHDPTEIDRQGPDIGYQYRSMIFYVNEDQQKTALKLTKILKKKNYQITTEVTKAQKFWPAELYHQDYYGKNGKKPYCHIYHKKFE